MKKLIFIAVFFCCTAALGAACLCRASDEGIYEPLYSQVSRALPENARRIYEDAGEPERVDFSSALRKLTADAIAPTRTYARRLVRTAAGVFVVCALCAAVRSFSEGSARVTVLTGAAAIAALCTQELSGILTVGRESLETLSLMSKTVLSSLCAAQMFGGAVSSGAAVYTASLFVSDLVISVIVRLMSPLVYIYCALVTAACVSANAGLSKLAKLLRSGVLWTLKLGAGIFSAYLAVSGVLAGRIGAAAVRSVKLASSAVPLVGSVLSDAAEAVAAGAAAARGIIGAAGVAGVIAVALVPFLKMAICCAAFRLSAAVASVTGADELSNYAEQLGDGFVLILAMCAVSGLMIIAGIFAAVLGASGL